MKKIVFTLLTGLFISLSAIAQNYTVTVNGTVMIVSENSFFPVPGQAVIITIDSSSFGFTYQNTVYTDNAGYYEDVIEIPGFQGSEYVSAMTFDSCQGQYQYQGQFIAPGMTIIPMDFYLCNNNPPGCQASFYYYQADPIDLNTFVFVNQSIGEYSEVLWDFGDSTYSNESNPVHTFPGEGTYYVCLTISGAECTSVYCDFVYAGSGGGTGCENYFFYYNANNDPYTLTFEGFLLNGQYAQSYWWDFGDGTTGSGQTVTHTFEPVPNGVAFYMVGLSTMVLDSTGTDSCFYTSYQEVWLQNQSGCESFILPISMYGLTVDFEGYTVSPYETEYTWEFGDGVTGTGQFVSHTYPAPGMYNVTLQTVDATGCSFETFTQIWLDTLNQGGCNTMFSYEQADSNTFTFYGYIYLNNGMIYPDSSTVFSWDFGDGTTATGQTVTHYFQGNPGGGYNVCLTATTILPDGVACTAVYCENISFVMPSFNIYGYIILDNNTYADQAIVHLMTMDTLWQGVIEVQSITIDSGGFYNFGEVPMYNSRLYYVQAELTEGSAYFGQYVPTYHESALSWEQATPILPLMNWPANIYMIAGSPVDGGNGAITGVVSDLGSRGFMNDVEIVLMDSDKNPLTYVKSNEQGAFSFVNLPLGTYVIHAEIMGIHTIQAEVTLTGEKPEMEIEVLVSAGEANIVFGVKENLINIEAVSDIYPNPVNGNARFDISVKKQINAEVSIFGQTGQLMNSEELFLSAGSHNIRLNVNSLPAGLYLLRITTGQGEVVSRKFMKAQ